MCGNYSREETIQGRKLFAEIRYLYFQICVSFHLCLVTVYFVVSYWTYPLKNIVGNTGCHIANFLRESGVFQIQLHSFIMATTRYIFLFHDALLLRFRLTPNVSAIFWLQKFSITYNKIFVNFRVFQGLWWDWMSFFPCFIVLSLGAQSQSILFFYFMYALVKNIWHFFLKKGQQAISLKQLGCGH